MHDLLSLHRDTVFLRREAIAAGYSDDDLKASMRAGLITRPRTAVTSRARSGTRPTSEAATSSSVPWCCCSTATA